MDRVREAMAITVLPRKEPFKAPSPMSSLRVTRAKTSHAVAAPTVKLPPTPSNDRPRITGLHLGAINKSPRTKAVKARTEPLEKSPEKVREERGPTCKPRPTSNRGNGGSRPFVPWCDKKR